MQVSSNANYAYSPEQNIQDLSQGQRDSLRQGLVAKAGKESKESQIEAYVAGTKQANETAAQYESNEEYVQNYTDFASDARQAQNYATLVENGVTLSDIPSRPSTQPIESIPLNEDQTDALRKGVAALAGHKSTQDQIEAYQAGSENSNSTNVSLDDTAQYVKNYNEFATDVRRSEYLNTYIENNNYLAG